MAHRLAKSVRRIDRILKNGLAAGNFNNLTQVQPRLSDFRQFLSQSSVYYSHEPPKFDKPDGLKKGKNGGPADIKGKEHIQKKNIAKRTTNAAFTLPPTAVKELHQFFKLGGYGGRGCYRKTNSRESFVVKPYEIPLDAGLIIIFIVTCTFVLYCRHTRENSFHQITWKEFCGYMTRGRVAMVEVTKKKFLRVAFEFTMALRLVIDILGCYKIVGPVTITLEIKIERKHEAPVVGKTTARKWGIFQTLGTR